MKFIEKNSEVIQLSKILRYELVKTSKMFFTLILAILVVNILMYPTVKNLMVVNEFWGGLALTILVVLMFVLNLLFTVMIISSFRRELYQDCGYLTFSLPISAKAYLGAKVITASFWSLLLTIFIIAVNLLTIYFFVSPRELELFLSFLQEEMAIKVTASVGLLLFSCFIFVVYLIVLYLSIVISKVLFKSNYLGFVWVLIYLLLATGMETLVNTVIKYLPYFYIFKDNSIQFISLTEKSLMSAGILYIHESTQIMPGLSIIAPVIYLIFGILSFTISYKLIEKKVDI